MATAKKGMIDKALDSTPAKATKDAIGKAASAVTDAFMDPPLAPDDVAPVAARKSMKRAPAKKTTAKKPSAKKASAKHAAAKNMDRKLVATMEDYEVKYLAQKHGVTQKAVKAAVAAVGHSRSKVEAELKRTR